MGKKQNRASARGASVGGTIAARLRRIAEAVEAGENITERLTRRTVRLRLAPRQYGPNEVKRTRQKLGASQAIFAQFLGVSPSAVQDWEQGLKLPHGAACRLMDEIRRDPPYWIRRLRELSVPIQAAR
jgi:DNA-binding transcriptional regulator YiaG